MSLLGLGLTIGGNLLGGIMGRKSQRKANRRAEENARAAADLAYERSKEYKPLHLKKMVAEAQAAGFNPLTILRNGGMGSTMGPGYGGAAVAPVPEQSLGSVFAETLTGVGQYYMNQPTADEVADDNLRREIMQAELDNLKADTNRMQQRPFGAGIPSATTTSDHRGAVPDGTSVRLFGVDTVPDADFSDAEDQEQRWGDVTSALLGIVTFGADVKNTIAAENRKAPLLGRVAPPEQFGPGRIFGHIPHAFDAWGNRIERENQRRRDASRIAPRAGNTWATP